jgi:hypothetical protein
MVVATVHALIGRTTTPSLLVATEEQSPTHLRGARTGYESCSPERQARESSDNPKLNAFCRVALSVRFNVLAILAA